MILQVGTALWEGVLGTTPRNHSDWSQELLLHVIPWAILLTSDLSDDSLLV